MKIGQIGGTNFPFFTKSNNFTRSHLLSYFKNIPELKSYLPDDVKDQSLVRDYLLNVSLYYLIFFRSFSMLGMIFMKNYIINISKLNLVDITTNGINIILMYLK